MWLRKIELQNIKCFKNVEVIFTQDQSLKKPYRWITLLGENGVGKSTLLQSISLLLAGPEAAKELLPRPTGWVRDQSQPGKLIAHICQDEEDQGNYGQGSSDWSRKLFSYAYHLTGDAEVKVPLRGRKRQKEEIYTEPTLIEESTNIISWLRVNAFASGNQGWFAAGYGSFRRLTRTSQILIPHLESLTRTSNFGTQFNEDTPLSSFERWMVYLDYRQAKDGQDLRTQQMRRIGENAVTNLLPTGVRIAEVTKDGLIKFEVNGQLVPTIGLSDGFRSVIALAGDLIWRLIQAFPEMEDPTQAPGIVLIDELDIHLHPIWQRYIADWMRKTFPNLQFVVATHSPLVAIGAGEDSLAIRFEMDKDNGEVKADYIQDIFTYDVDQVLRSPAFNLISTYSPEIQESIRRYHQLRLQFEVNNNLNNEEKALFETLTQLMRKINLENEPPEPGSLVDRMNRFLEENLPQ